MVHCENCDRAYEHADELDHETADEVTLVEDGEKPASSSQRSWAVSGPWRAT